MPISCTNTQPVALRALRTVAAVAALLSMQPAAAADSTVPLDLQVALLQRVVRFERGFVDRAGGEVRVLILTRADSAGSTRTAAQLGKAFEVAHDIAGAPIKVITQPFASPAALKAAIATSHAQLVYLTSGFDGDIAAIAAALDRVTAITICTDADQVERGAVLGFELVSTRPKIVLNLGQARRQGLDFNSDLFRLARVIR